MVITFLELRIQKKERSKVKNWPEFEPVFSSSKCWDNSRGMLHHSSAKGGLRRGGFSKGA